MRVFIWDLVGAVERSAQESLARSVGLLESYIAQAMAINEGLPHVAAALAEKRGHHLRNTGPEKPPGAVITLDLSGQAEVGEDISVTWHEYDGVRVRVLLPQRLVVLPPETEGA